MRGFRALWKRTYATARRCFDICNLEDLFAPTRSFLSDMSAVS